jgi:hypothetical protein
VFINIVHHDSTGKSKQLSILNNLNPSPSQTPLAEYNPNNFPPNHHLNSPSTIFILANLDEFYNFTH